MPFRNRRHHGLVLVGYQLLADVPVGPSRFGGAAKEVNNVEADNNFS